MSESQERRFREWIDTHGEIVQRVASVHALTKADRSDLIQQILIELWKSARLFDGRCAATTWIYRVAVNTALTFQRSEGRRRRRFVHADEELLTSVAEEPTKIRPIEQLYAAIHQLEPLDRSLVMMSLDARNYEQMAEVTGLSVSNVGVRLLRARRKLAALIEDTCYDA